MSSADKVDLVEPLTEREQEVLGLLSQGMSDREMAEALVLSINTVKWHNRQIYGKLGVGNRHQAAERARHLGLLDVERDGATPTNNLPAPLTKLIGRDAELEKLRQLLANRDVRLITVTGLGGVGKTRLAYAAAQLELERKPCLFDDGIYLVSLSSLDAPEQLPAAIADALDFPLQTSRENGRAAWRQLSEYLQEKNILLLLDNFEHLLQGARAIGELVKWTTTLQVIVTSRERLKLRGERILSLAGFASRNWDAMLDASGDPFVQLFLENARRVRPDFELTSEDLAPLARLREVTGGLPLAVELAARWIDVLPLQEIVAAIRQDMDFLQTDLHNVPLRQRSMRAVFATSWSRLDGMQQAVFARLSVFRGGFSREAAKEVGGATLINLTSLVAKSLVRYDIEQDRYYVHELLRQFGEEKLEGEPELEQDTRQRHAAFYCRFLHERRQAWDGGGAEEALVAVAREMGNVRSAWRWAVRQGAASLLAKSLDSLCAYYNRRGYVDEVRELLRVASDAMLSRPVEEDDDVTRRRFLVRLLLWRSLFDASFEEAGAMLDQAEEMLAALQRQEVDVRREEASLAFCKGLSLIAVNPRAARPWLERSQSLYQELGFIGGQARATENLGELEWHLGNYAEAAEMVRQALEEHKALGNHTGVATGLKLLGLIEKHRGRLGEALEAHRESYALYREVGVRTGEAVMAANLASTLDWSGKFSEARIIAAEGLRLAEEVGLREGPVAFLEMAFAKSCIPLGRYDEARPVLERAIATTRAADRPQTLGWALVGSGQLRLVAGSYEAAAERFEEAAATLRAFGKSIWTLPCVYHALALQRLGQMREARRRLAEALSENMRPAVPHVAVSALPAAAELVAAKGDVSWALELYALACRYPFVANSRWFEDVMGEDVAEWESALPPDDVEEARERGRSRDLWQTAEELLDEFGDAAGGG